MLYFVYKRCVPVPHDACILRLPGRYVNPHPRVQTAPAFIVDQPLPARAQRRAARLGVIRRAAARDVDDAVARADRDGHGDGKAESAKDGGLVRITAMRQVPDRAHAERQSVLSVQSGLNVPVGQNRPFQLKPRAYSGNLFFALDRNPSSLLGPPTLRRRLADGWRALHLKLLIVNDQKPIQMCEMSIEPACQH